MGSPQDAHPVAVGDHGLSGHDRMEPHGVVGCNPVHQQIENALRCVDVERLAAPSPMAIEQGGWPDMVGVAVGDKQAADPREVGTVSGGGQRHVGAAVDQQCIVDQRTRLSPVLTHEACGVA